MFKASDLFSLSSIFLSLSMHGAMAQSDAICNDFSGAEYDQCLTDLESFGGLPTGRTQGSCIEIIVSTDEDFGQRWVCLGDGNLNSGGGSAPTHLLPLS